MDNRLNCDNSYMKDLFDDGKETVCICSCDNVYIGYSDEAEKEKCRFKTAKCIRTEHIMNVQKLLGILLES